uniref:Anaphase-promoting complex subunit 4 WD40 domain-containing protein n=1 Tax=Spongospora subterranea TaxID=70186 RepID=A0A0H5R7D0_9EUKA|eukprot:CRZ09662.1 hypothetical protein [Spongospora subterranea]
MTCRDNSGPLIASDLPLIKLQASIPVDAPVTKIALSGSLLAVVVSPNILQIYERQQDCAPIWTLVRSADLCSHIRSIAWTADSVLALAAHPGNLWIGDACIEDQTWVEHIAGNRSFVVGAGISGLNSNPCIWAWDSYKRVRLWNCSLNLDNGKPVSCDIIPNQDVAVMVLDTGSVFLVRNGTCISDIDFRHPCTGAIFLQPSSNAVPGLLVMHHRSQKMLLVSLESCSAIELPFVVLTSASALGDLLGFSLTQGSFSIFSLSHMGDGPLLTIPFCGQSTVSISFHPTCKLFAIGLQDRFHIYGV